MQQLNSVNGMTDQQRQRRLARAENLERLPAEDRMRVNRSAQEWTTLPDYRQTVMRNAFRDLRSVPPDQRSMALNSSRYQGQFTPQERGILSDLLRVSRTSRRTRYRFQVSGLSRTSGVSNLRG